MSSSNFSNFGNVLQASQLAQGSVYNDIEINNLSNAELLQIS